MILPKNQAASRSLGNSFETRLQRALVPQSFMSQHREEFSKSKAVDKKWFIRIGRLWGWQVGGWEMLCPKNLPGYSFTIKNVGRGRRTSFFFLSRHHASIISSSSRLSRGVFLSLQGQARSTNYCFSCVQAACPGLPWWLSGKESACQCRRRGFNPRVRKIPWRRKW